MPLVILFWFYSRYIIIKRKSIFDYMGCVNMGSLAGMGKN